MAYVILSISGGGVRGTIPAVGVGRMAEQVPNWREKVDLLAGTSTGGLIALSLAAGVDATKVVDLYVEHAKEIHRKKKYGFRLNFLPPFYQQFIDAEKKEGPKSR